MDLIETLLDRIPSFEKISLMKEFLKIPSVYDYDIISDDDSDFFNLCFYNKSLKFSYLKVFENPLRVQDFVIKKIDKAKYMYDKQNIVLNPDEMEISNTSGLDFFMREIPKIDNEERLAELFSGDLDSLREFVDFSSRKSGFLEETRGFLREVLDDPYVEFWSK